MKLFDGAGAPSPRKVRMYLAEKGIAVERVTLNLRAGEHLQPAFLAINPRGMLPALLLDDGTMIDESVAICRYFEALHPDPNLFGLDARESALIESWTRRIETDCYAAIAYAFRNSNPAFKDRAVTGRWPPLAQIPELVTRGRIMFDSFAKAIDEQLGRFPYVAGKRYTFADTTLHSTLDFGKIAGMVPPEGLHNVMRWWDEMAQRKSAAA